MNNIESRIEKLEKQTGKESGGHEMLIKYRNGESICFRKGDGPPWHTTVIEVVYDQTEAERKAFAENMNAIFDGELSDQGEDPGQGESHDTRTKN